MSAGQTIAVGILAGGESRRFGSDKALAVHAGISTLEWLVTRLWPQVQSLWVASRPGQSRPRLDGVNTVQDGSGAGPLAGVQALLAAMDADWLLVLPVDLLELPPDWVAGWRRALTGADAAVRALVLVDAAGDWQPVHCLLHRSLAASAAAALTAGRYGLGDWLRRVGALPVRLPQPRCFNTVAEWQQARVESASPVSSDR